jgi:hypothetical protein
MLRGCLASERMPRDGRGEQATHAFAQDNAVPRWRGGVVVNLTHEHGPLILFCTPHPRCLIPLVRSEPSSASHSAAPEREVSADATRAGVGVRQPERWRRGSISRALTGHEAPNNRPIACGDFGIPLRPSRCRQGRHPRAS